MPGVVLYVHPQCLLCRTSDQVFFKSTDALSQGARHQGVGGGAHPFFLGTFGAHHECGGPYRSGSRACLALGATGVAKGGQGGHAPPPVDRRVKTGLGIGQSQDT